jgi:hypothetical protein
MHGPFVVVFDPSGDLWAANVNTSTLVELTRAELATPDPAPAVTISAGGDALEYPYGMAFDRRGNLWVVGNDAGRVYEYAKSQLGRSGSPTPVSTISDLPGTPLGDAFDPYGDLWVTTQLSPDCPEGCVVEFSRAELATASPTPTVTISSTGGANIAFTPSGDMWMVTGGGPLDDCYGTPCNNELVEFTKAQLSNIGFPHACRHDQLDRPWHVLRVSMGSLRGGGRPLWRRVGLQLQQAHRGRVRHGPALRIGVAHPSADHCWQENRDELALLRRHRAVSAARRFGRARRRHAGPGTLVLALAPPVPGLAGPGSQGVVVGR